MSRFEQSRDERAAEALPEVVLEQNVDCPECGTMFEVLFHTGENDLEMVDDPDMYKAQATCPGCGNTWTQDYDGWTARTDAG